MASKEGDSEPRESKTWVLKVSIHCEGCKKKVRKILQRIKGVDTIEINSQKNQVIVTGNVEAETLIKKLLKSGKHSELWPTEKKPENPKPKHDTNNEKLVKEKNETKEDASKSSESTKPLETKPDIKTETDTKPEVDTKPESSKPDKQASETKQPETKSIENDEKMAETSKEGDEKKAENDIKPSDNEKRKKKEKKERKKKEKKEKKVVETEGRSIDVTPPMDQHPIYHQPMYVSSYNMAQPTQSYAHVVPMPQNYASSMNPPQATPNFPYPNHPNYPNYPSYESLNHPPQEQYPNYNPSYPPNYPSYPMNYPSYSNENFHGSMGYEASSSSSQQGSYDYFNDENPNSCSVM